MDVISISPFRTGSVLWRPRPDRWTLTVVCKATYALEPVESTLAVDQEGVNEHDGFWDDDPRRSVHTPSDLAPFKPRADVTLVGHAYAPRSEIVRSLVARLMVGEMEKAVEVFCPRVVGREGELREGPRWNKMPLRYEYAAGGLDTWNPVGVGPSAPADPYGQRPLPHLQPPGLRVTQWRDIFVPTGFGPISATWRLRRERLGRRVEGWSDESWPRLALDDDFDGEFFQVAPLDQQIDVLHDDERLVLEYLHPDHPSLTTKLPGVHPRTFVEIPGSPTRELVMTADTLWIDTDRALCTLTWRGQVAVDGPNQQGRVIVALEEAGQNLNWAALSNQRLSGGTLVPDAPEGGRWGTSTLPFVPPDSPTPASLGDDAGEPTPTPRTEGPRTPPMNDARPAPVPRSHPPGRRKTLSMIPEKLAAPPAWLSTAASSASSSPAPPPSEDAYAGSTMGLRPPSPSGLASEPSMPGFTPYPRPPLPEGYSQPLPAEARLHSIAGSEGGYPPTGRHDGEYPLVVGPPVNPSAARERPSTIGRTPATTQLSGHLDALHASARPSRVPERAFELLWFAPSLGARLRREVAFAQVLAVTMGETPKPPAQPAEPSAVPDAAAVLARGTPSAAHLEHVLFEAASGGALVAPLLLLAGELSFFFDEVEELRSLIGAARPAARADVGLAAFLDFAEEMARTELQGSPEVAEGLCTSVRDAWAQANHVLPAGHLGQQVERALLFRRAYQRRELFGKKWIRALFTPASSQGGERSPVPAYLPAAAAARLPLFRHFPARLLVEVLPQQDQGEASPVALRVVALAREVSRIS